MARSFKRIVHATKQEVTVDDLYSESWIVASEIAEKRGRDIDFSDPVDQNLVMGYLYNRQVRRGDWHMRKSVRIDRDSEAEEGAIKWSERLPAADTFDPLVSLLKREASIEADATLLVSYSQAAAYFRTFAYFKHDWIKVREHLAISDHTLSGRLAAAEAIVLIQRSLFDGHSRISKRFVPLPGRAYSAKHERHLGSVQWAWTFDDA